MARLRADTSMSETAPPSWRSIVIDDSRDDGEDVTRMPTIEDELTGSAPLPRIAAEPEVDRVAQPAGGSPTDGVLAVHSRRRSSCCSPWPVWARGLPIAGPIRRPTDRQHWAKPIANTAAFARSAAIPETCRLKLGGRLTNFDGDHAQADQPPVGLHSDDARYDDRIYLRGGGRANLRCISMGTWQ